VSEERHFEMLWDCAYCGTRKLLGKSQRFCPKCGAPQDPERRYFPPPGEEVAVEDHVYVGADRVCSACQSAMSAKAVHCTQCGAPLEGAGEVKRIGELPPPQPQQQVRPAVGAAPAARGVVGCVVGAVALALLLVGGLLVTLFWKKDAEARVTGVSWQRSIVVESFQPRRDTAWCDSLPRDAYSVSRHREVRSHRRVPAGEDCRNVNVDRGDGTFTQRRECTPRYREEPVYDERCDFTVDRWGELRRATADGQDHALAPAWPALSLRAGVCRGCEREGRRTSTYKVALTTADNKRLDCEVSEAQWPSFAPGSRWALKQGVVTGSPDCKSLKPVGN
jgi:hypothetical protein